MKEELFIQAKQILSSFQIEDVAIKNVLAELEKVDINAGIGDLIKSPSYSNIINILGPYAVYYKVDQVLKLLKELSSEFKDIGRGTYPTVPSYMKEKLY